jgi:hypothetical protein
MVDPQPSHWPTGASVSQIGGKPAWRAGGLTFVIGAPRSGTTWIAKVFDSHPNVLYRHEPDLVEPAPDFPIICNRSDWARHTPHMRGYIDRLIATRNLKALGSLPVFCKSFDRPFGRERRMALIAALRLAQTVRARSVHDHRLPTEFFDFPPGFEPHVTIKSIGSLGWAGLLAEALPEARIVLIVRNPLQQIASRRVGISLGKFDTFRFKPALLATEQARRLGVTAETIARASPIEQLAWDWALLNEKAYEDLGGRNNVTVIRYSDVVRDPIPRLRALFDFAGLDWRPVTEAFVHRSVNYRGPDMYFQVMKDASRSLEKWRATLSEDDRTRILAITERTSLAGLWPEYFAPAEREVRTARVRMASA